MLSGIETRKDLEAAIECWVVAQNSQFTSSTCFEMLLEIEVGIISTVSELSLTTRSPHTERSEHTAVKCTFFCNDTKVWQNIPIWLTPHRIFRPISNILLERS